MKRKWTIALSVLAAGLAVWYMFCLPRDLFAGTCRSTVVNDRNGELLGARIAEDGQWRFPVECSSSGALYGAESGRDGGRKKYFKALIRFEDRWFRWHPGVNPISIVRAAVSNLKAGHVVSGGSTISMQVIRLSRRKERTVGQKLIEAILATRLELRCSKNEILELYAANAPFGGNVVGLEAASWRYFGRPADELSWAEAATLAVLPNSPSSIRPGKNRDRLVEKRNRLLARLRDDGEMDDTDCELACSEPLPTAPVPLPSYASHLVDDYASGLVEGTGPGRSYRTSIDLSLQRRVEDLLARKSAELAAEGINDLSAIVMDVRTGETVAYCGNADPDRKRPGVRVDIARSPRSSGSILKPFLYCAALQDGVILPYSLIPDTPVNIDGFTPQNYNMDYDGAVPAAEALSRSLNVPAVHMLREYGVQRFLEVLRGCGMTTFGRSADDYGLSLILGGGECRLDEVTAAYASLARQYLCGGNGERNSASSGQKAFPLNDRVAIWYTLDALKDVNRPDEIDWHIIRSVRKVAWKTGTSYGYRDAWAVGADPDFAVGVWAGNASGVGSPALLGARAAGPVLFDIFNLLPSRSPYCNGDESLETDWFPEPLYTDGIRAEVCDRSGFLAGDSCPEKSTVQLPAAALKSGSCPYHFSESGGSVFRLTPAMEWFYRKRHPEYESTSGSASDSAVTGPMEFIYPENGSCITIPVQLDGTPGEIILNLAHHDTAATVYWHLDDNYLGETRFIHHLRIRPSPGKHTVTVVDNNGNTLSISITIM